MGTGAPRNAPRRAFPPLTDPRRGRQPHPLAGFGAWWCNGSTGDFDSPSPGSNPGRAANFPGRSSGSGSPAWVRTRTISSVLVRRSPPKRAEQGAPKVRSRSDWPHRASPTEREARQLDIQAGGPRPATFLIMNAAGHRLGDPGGSPGTRRNRGLRRPVGAMTPKLPASRPGRRRSPAC